MTKPIAFIGTNGHVPASWMMAGAVAFQATGLNTGNLAFQYAMDRLVLGERRHMKFQFDPAEVRASCRLICVPAANFLYSRFDFGDLAAKLEATGLPLLVVGLGAQAGRDPSEVVLKPGTERLLRVFSERCTRIVIRGRHTAAVMERYGVHNFEVLGCPSNFINPDPKLGAGILQRFRGQGPARIAYAPTFYPHNAAWERRLYDEIGGRLSEVVCQEPREAVSLARGERTPDVQAWLNEKSGFVAGLKQPEERGRLASLSRAYFSVDAWMEAYKRVDVVIGSRIHGASLGWQAARPSCVVAHDLRTAELAESMGLPVVHAAEVKATGPSVVELLSDRLPAAAEAYDRRRQDLGARLLDVFSSSGVDAARHLHDLAGPASEAQTGQEATAAA